MAELAFSEGLQDDATVAIPPPAAEISSPPMTVLEPEVAAGEPAPVDHSDLEKIDASAQPAVTTPAVAELCIPLAEATIHADPTSILRATPTT